MRLGIPYMEESVVEESGSDLDDDTGDDGYPLSIDITESFLRYSC